MGSTTALHLLRESRAAGVPLPVVAMTASAMRGKRERFVG